MLPNIDQQHEQLLAALLPYWAEQTAWNKHIFRLAFFHPIRFLTLALPAIHAQHKKTPIDRLSGRTGEEIRRLVPKLADLSRTDAEKELLNDLLADFSVHVIAEKMLLKFPDFDFAKVKELHDARRTDRLKLNTMKLVTGVLTVAAFLGKSVPKSVVENDFSWNYELFEQWLFYITCFLLAYFGLLVALEWLGIRRDMEKHEYIGRILFYLDLIYAKK